MNFRIFIITYLFFTVCFFGQAQSDYDIQLSLNQVDCNNNTVCYDVQLRTSNGTSWGLAGQNYRIYYNSALGSYKSGVSVLGASYQDFTLVQDAQNLNSSGTGSLAFEDNLSFLNYSIDLNNTSSGGVSLPSDGSWLTTSQLCFDVQSTLLNDPNTCFEAVWARSGLTDEYATSFVEVSEWVAAENTQMANGVGYDDLDSSDGEVACLANSCANVGNYDIQMTLGQVDCENNTVCYNVQLSSSNGTWDLAGQNYRLYYDGTLGSYKSGVSLLDNTDYANFTLNEDVQHQNATGTGNLGFENDLSFLNYSIDLSNTSNGGTALPADGSWLTTSQLCFDVQSTLLTDPNTCFEAVWARSGLTDEYATSFVEVSEWVAAENTQMANGVGYDDLDSSDGEAACLANSCANVGNYDIQMTLGQVDCENNTVCYNVQLSSSNGTWDLAGQNYRLYYDGTLGSYKSGVSLLDNTDYASFTLNEDVQHQNAMGTGNLGFENDLSFLNYSIDLSNTSNGGTTLPADGSWLTTSQLCFDVQSTLLTDPNTCFEAVWARNGLTDEYATSFVEVSEWVAAENTQMANGVGYDDLDSSDGEAACLANSCANVGNYDIQMTLGQVDCENNTVCYNVQLSSSNGAWDLAGQNYRLYYDGTLGSYKSGVSLLDNTDYANFTLNEDVQHQNAMGTGNLGFENDLSFLNYSIDLSNTSNGGTTLPADGSWLTTSQLCFDVQSTLLNDPNTCFEAVWARNGLTDEYATSFVEVSEWVAAENTQMANGVGYDDLNSSDGEVACLANSCMPTGQYGIQLSLNNLDCQTNTACYDVQLSSTDGNSWALGGQNYRLYYDATLGDYQSGISLLGTTDYNGYTLIQDIPNSDASGTGNLAFESNLSFLNYTIDLHNTTSGGIYLPADGSWVTTSQLCFQLTNAVTDDPATCFEAIWARMDTSAAYATSFVEVTEWVGTENTRMADGTLYNDLGDYNACFETYATVYDTLRTTICEGDFYTFDGQNLTVAGNYNDTLMGTIACDSILTLVLTINPTPTLSTRDTSICVSESLDLALLTTSTASLQYYNTLAEAVTANNAITSTIAITGNATYYVRASTSTNPICHVIDSIQVMEQICGNFDLALQKVLAPNQPAVFSPEDTVRFIIKVINQGTKDAYNYTVVDYTQNSGLNFINDGIINPNWALFGTNPSTFGLPQPLMSGDTTLIPIAFIIDAGVDSMMLTNIAEISSADDDLDTANPRPTDSDSGFDALPDNDIIGGDNILDNSNFDEDDHDLAKVFICIDKSTTLNKEICQGSSFNFNGQDLTVANTYTANLTAADGCDSIVTLNLAVVPNKSTTLNEEICQGSSFTFNGQDLTVANTYTANLTAADGCDSIVTLNLAVVSNKSTTLNEEICQGSSFTFNGQDLTVANTYTANLTAVDGCDSIVTLNLAVVPNKSTTLNEEICQGSAFTFNGQSLTIANTYTANLTAADGCDSIVTLNLAVVPNKSTTLNEEICQGSAFTFNGQSLTIANTYTANLTAADGCDSIVTLNLAVVPNKSTTLNEEICQGSTYTFNGGTITNSGIYVANLTSAGGCDSIVTLNLAVVPNKSTTLNEEICQGGSYTLGTLLLISTGTYMETFRGSEGCDSIVTVNLTVVPSKSTTLNEAICQGSSYSFNGEILTVANTYTANLTAIDGCDSIVTLNLTVIPLPTLSTKDTLICTGRNLDLNGLVVASSGAAKFYPSEIHAINETNEVAGTLTTAGTETFYARINSSLASNCYVIEPMTIQIENCNFDLALEKTISPNQITPFEPGDTVDYSITIHNQGAVPAYDIDINDYPQSGLIFSQDINPNWMFINKNYRTNIQGPLAPNEMTSVSIRLIIDENFQGSKLNNIAEIVFADNDLSGSNPTPTDTDSTPNNNVAGEDDQDNEEITVKICVITTTTLNEEICQGTTYNFNGQVLTQAGTYTATLKDANNCDSMVTLTLAIVDVIINNITANICQGQSYTLGTQTLTTSGTFVETFKSSGGCDSIVSLALTVTPLPVLTFSNATQNLCLNQTLDLSTIISNTTGTISYHNNLNDAENGENEVSSTVVGQGTTTYYIRATSIFDPTCYTIESVIVTDQDCHFDLALTKKLAEEQLSGVKVGDTINYTITVYNQGAYDAYNVDVVDYIPTGLSFTNTVGWTITSANTVQNTIDFLAAGMETTLQIGLSVDAGFEDTQLTNIAEISGATTEQGTTFVDDDSTLDNFPNNDGTPINDAIDNPNDEDDHDFETIEVGVFDLALTKSLAPNQPVTVDIGEDIDYVICVQNEGNIAGYNVLVADHIPNGLALSTRDTNNWTVISTSLVTKEIPGPIYPQEEACIYITLTLNSGDRGADFVNIAEIAGNQDSQGNNIKDNDSNPDLIDENEEGDEDDSGSAIISLTNCPALTITPTTANICQGAAQQITTSINAAGATYSWTPTTGLDNPFSSNPIASPSVSTTYIVAVNTGIVNCIAYDTVRVNVFDVPNPDFRASTVCQGEMTSFTDRSVTYTTLTNWYWDFGDGIGFSTEQNPSYTFSTAGQHQVKLVVTSTNGCRDSISKTIMVYPSVQASSLALGDTICVGACVELKAQGGTAFLWSPSATLNHDTCFNPIACPTETTTYAVTVTNDFGCASTDEVTVTVIPGPTIDVDMTNISECGQFDGSITINTTGLASNYEYSIDGGLTFRSTNTFTNLPASSYLVVVRGGGCEVPYAGNPVIIGEGLTPMITNISSVYPDCNANNGSIIINATGTNLRYSINGGINFFNNNEFTDLSGGSYYIAVATDGNNCITYFPQVSLVQPTAPTITDVQFTPPTDCGKRDGVITIIADGAEGVEYGLNDGMMTIWQSSNNFINLVAGTYSIFVRNAGNTCMTPYTLGDIILNAPENPELLAVNVNQPSDCGLNDGSINIVTTAGNTDLVYSIDGGINWQATANFINLPPDNYNVLVRNQDGTCAVSYPNNPIEIIYPDATQITEVLHQNPTDCGINNGRIEITARGGSNDLIYSVDGGTTWQDSNVFTNLTGGIYNVRVANSDESCMAIYPTIELISPSSGTIEDVNFTTGCDLSNRTISIIATNSTPLEYSIDGGATYQASNNFINLAYGTYSIFIRNIDDACPIAYTNNPIEINPPDANSNRLINHIQTGDPTTCGATDGFIEVNVTGVNVTYSIDGGINYGAQNTFDNLAAGEYYVYVKQEGTGCEEAYIFNPVELVGVSEPTIETVSTTNLSDCNANDGTITIVADGEGGLQFSLDGTTWSNGNTFINLLPGLYNAWVRYDDESCAIPYGNNPIVVTAPTGPIITDCFGINPSDCNVDDGQLIITATGGSGPLKYSIDGGTVWQNSNEFSNLAAGVYSVAVANADETCKAIHPMCVLTAPAPPIINEVQAFDPVECGLDNGAIFISAQGNGGLEFSIDEGLTWSTNSFFFNLAAGTYAIKVRNAQDNCEIDYPAVTLNSPSQPTIISGIDNQSTCTGSFIPVSITMSESIADYAIIGSGAYLNANVVGATLTFDAYLSSNVDNFVVYLNNADGCTIEDDFVIFQTAAPVADFILDNSICAEQEVTITFNGTASPAASLFWNPTGGTIISSSPATATAPAAATIVVRWDTPGDQTISLEIDDGGCTAQKTEALTVNKLPFADAGADVTICEGECVQLNGNGSGAVYQWTPAIGLSATDIPNPLACPPVTTTYQLLVMGAEGCMMMDEITITVAGELMASAGADVAVCEGESVQLNATGGTNYQWSPTIGLNNPNIANPIASPTSITTYSVTITNANGCKDVDEVIVTVNSQPIINAGQDVEICIGENAMLSALGGISYEWSPSTGLSATNVPNPIASPSITTTYTVIGTDINGCTSIDEVIVHVGNNAHANAGSDVNICLGASTQLNASGGVNYSWTPTIGLSNPNIANPIANPSSTTTYNLTVVNAAGCIGTDEITINVDGFTAANAGSDQTICSGSQAFLNATGGISYSWSPSTGLSNPNIANPIANPNQTTTYTVTSTNAQGCTGTDQITVFVNGNASINAGNDQTICSGSQAFLNATGGISYSWSPSTGLSNPNIANPIANPSQTTTYTVTSTNAQGCTGTDQVTVFVNGNAPINAGNDQTICSGSQAFLNATGGVSYSWNPSTGLSNPNIANPIASPSQTTTYTVTSTNAQGCTGIDQITVFVNGNAPINAGSDQTTCSGSQVFLNATGGVTYSWSPTFGLSNPNIANPTFTPISTTTFTVTATTAQGCVGIDQVTVYINGNCDSDGDGFSDAEEDANGNGIVDPGESDPYDPCDPLGATANISQVSTICAGQSVGLNATGGVTYSWSPTFGLSNPNIANPIASPNQTTNYCVTVTNARGCTDVACMTVNVAPSIVVVGCPDKHICGNGNVRLTVNGGVSWVWSPSTGLDNPYSPAPVASPNQTTVYTVTGTDAYGCSASDEVTVFVNGNAAVNAGSDQTICQGMGAILNATGGTTYSWNPIFGLNNPTIANPVATPSQTTTYTVTATNSQGCTGTDQVTVFVNTENITNAGNDRTICQGNTTQLNATGGTTYTWSPTFGLSNPNIANPIANPSQTTTYTVTTTSANGCAGSDQVTVFVTSGSEVVACADQTICQGGSTPLSVTAGVTYHWSPATGLSNTTIPTPIATPSQTTTYTVFVTDANGCTGTDQVTVFVNNNTIANAGPDQTVCSGQTAQLNAAGGITYNWSPTFGLSNPNIANPIVTPVATTTYTVTITTAQGCTDTDQVTIFVGNNTVVNAGLDQSICRGASTQLNASGGFSYVWSPSVGLSNPNIANPIANPSQTTTYTVTTNNGQGCTNTDQITVFVQNAPTVTPSIIQPGCCNNNGSISLQVSGGSGNYNYNWSPNISNSNFATGLAEGVYKVIISDNQGCEVVSNITLTRNCQCQPIAPESEVCVNSPQGIGQICLPVHLNDISNYEIRANGAIIYPNHGCNFTNLTAYSYAIFPNQGNGGPYKIDSWVVNGVIYNGMINSMPDLVAWMNTVDPTGGWTLSTSGLIIVGGNPNYQYANMKLTQQSSWISTTLTPNVTGVPQYTLVEVPMNGASNVIVNIKNLQTCCEETVLLKVCDTPRIAPTCEEDIIDLETVDLSIPDCNALGELCIPISLLDIFDYEIAVNGISYTEGFAGCNFDTLYAYTYYTIPNRGTNGPYKVNAWSVNGQIFTGEFNNLEELVNLMNEWDNGGNWQLIASTLTIQGGLPKNTYGQMSIVQINTGATATMELNTNLIPMGTVLSFAKGTNEVLITNKETGCIDQFTAIVNCEEASKVDCDDLFEETSTTYSLEDCSEQAAICINISSEDLGIYSIDQNGSFYTGEIRKCDSDSSRIQLFASSGKHIFTITNELDDCTDKLIVKVTCPSSIKHDLATTPVEQVLSPTLDKDKFPESVISDNISNTDLAAQGRASKLQQRIKIYTGISPNRDGINDYLKIEGLEGYPNNELKIYNRFGQLLFEQKNYQNDWGGEVNGEILPNGTYFYLLTDGIEKQYSGFIQIER